MAVEARESIDPVALSVVSSIVATTRTSAWAVYSH